RMETQSVPEVQEKQWRRSVLLLVGLVLLVAGCEQSVDPIVGSEHPYTIWGFMNAGADTQVVRVFPIREELFPELGSGIDARVFSTDLTTGERREWTYEVVQFDSLIEGHLFKSPFRAEFEHRYRLEVVRSDGATSSAEVVVPPEVTFEIDVDPNSTIIPVRIEGDAPILLGVLVTYHATNVISPTAWPPPPETVIPPTVQLPVSISYRQLARRVHGGWAFDINMGRDFAAVHAAYEANCLLTEAGGFAPDIWLRRMDFSLVAADSSWAPPGGVFDPNILSVPGTFSNVENGYGYFGAGIGIVHDWSPNLEVAQRVGYQAFPRCIQAQ